MPTSSCQLFPRSSAAIAVILALSLLIVACGGDPAIDGAAVADNNRGVALMGRFDYTAAHEIFETLALRFPADDEIAVNLAIATLNRQQEGDDEAALVALEQVLVRSPNHLRARYCSGLLLLHRGEPAEALIHLEAVLAADPDDADAAYLRGQSLMQLEEYAEAVSSFTHAVELDPYLRSAYYRAFQGMQRLDQAEEAGAMLETFQALADNPRARLVELKYTKMGRRGVAEPLQEPGLEPPPPPHGDLFGPPSTLDGQATDATSLTVVDLDHDGVVDLLHIAPSTVYLVAADGQLTAAPEHPLSNERQVIAALWGDVDNDGRTDVFLLREGGNRLLLQTADGGFEDITEAAGVGGPGGPAVDGTLVDADHDGDLDILVVDAEHGLELYSNNRNGSFRRLAAEVGLQSEGAAAGLLVADLDGDEDADILLRGAASIHTIFVNDLLWRYRSEDSEAAEALLTANVAALVHGDADADGRSEIYTLDPSGNVNRWNVEGKSFVASPLATLEPSPQPSLSMADVDGDGHPDVVASAGNGVVILSAKDGRQLASVPETGPTWALVGLRPAAGPSLVSVTSDGTIQRWDPGPGRFPFVTLSLSGREDGAASIRSNASGIGARIVARAGSRWTITDTLRSSSGPGQSLQPLLLGLGNADRLDYVAIDWSDGVYQTELDLVPGAPVVIEETQRQLSSCPLLFAWSGSAFTFVSDLLGVGGMGYMVEPGVYSEPRPWEGFLLSSKQLVPHEGTLQLKLGEPMEEVTYLDGVTLEAVDLPPGWSMVLDERLGILGPAPTGEAIFYSTEVLPRSAHNERGMDVTDDVLTHDLKAAPVGDLDLRFIGRLSSEHILTLEFAEPLDRLGRNLVLVVDGWVEYPYSQTNFAAWQASAAYEAPTLEARAPGGDWAVVAEQFGYPAGMPRRMALPLPPLPPGTSDLRLRTNQEIYWDRIAVAAAAPCPEAIFTSLTLNRAVLDQVGFPIRADLPQRLPSYDYDSRAPYWDTRHLTGYLTRMGEVLDLVDTTDNALAIFGPGEEIHLEFEAPVPAPKDGWTRIYRLTTHGWCKDRDRFTGDGETVEPIPSRGEPSTEARQLNDDYNTRYVAGRM